MSWVSVSEELPPAWQRVLFVAKLDSGQRICFGCWASDGNEWMAESEYDQDGNHLRTGTTTHWMPLPGSADPAWINVSDKLPEPRHTVPFVAVFESSPQLCFGSWTGDGAGWKDQTDYDRTGEYRGVYTTTHWVPLPELPESVA